MYFSLPSHTTSSCYSIVAWTFSLYVYRVSAQTCGPLDWMQQVIIINCAFVVKGCFDFPVWVCREINTAETQEEETRTESRLFSQSNMILYSSCGTLFVFSLPFRLSFCVWPRGSFSTELAQTGGQRQRKLGRRPFSTFPAPPIDSVSSGSGLTEHQNLQEGLDNPWVALRPSSWLLVHASLNISLEAHLTPLDSNPDSFFEGLNFVVAQSWSLVSDTAFSERGLNKAQ